MIEWWNSLSLASQVFYCCAVPSTLILIIQTVMMFVGMADGGDGGSDGVEDMFDAMRESGESGGGFSADIDTDVSDGVFGPNTPAETPDPFGLDSLRIFTIQGIVAFFVVFGWVGAAMQAYDIHLAVTVITAALSGFAMMVLLALLMRAVMKLRSDGNLDNRNAIGVSGKVYLTIPPSRSGEGKVQVMLQGSYVDRDAVTDDTEAIPTGSEVVVVGISGLTNLVVRRK